MSPSCPLCGRPFAPGALSCTTCGASLLLDAEPGGTQPVCALHPGRQGLGTCERCGAFACAACLRPGPRGEVWCARCQALEPDAPLPWDERGELGMLRALWRTTVQVMIHPDVFSRSRADGPARESLLFALLCSLPNFFMVGVVYLVLFGAMPQFVAAFAPAGKSSASAEGMAVMPWVGVGLFFAVNLLGPLVSLVMSVIGSGVEHLVLRAGGVTRGFSVTLRAHCLSEAPYVLGIVPLLGGQVAPFWSLVSRVFAFRGLHRTTWGVALVGALLVPLGTCFLCCGGYLSILAFAVSRGMSH